MYAMYAMWLLFIYMQLWKNAIYMIEKVFNLSLLLLVAIQGIN